MDARFLYTAELKVAEPMDREFLNSVHSLVDHLRGSVTDDVRTQGHRLRIDKVLATLSVTFAIAADLFDDARRLARCWGRVRDSRSLIGQRTAWSGS